MYDLETLRRLNEQACLAAVALASSNKPPSVQAEEKTRDVGPPPVFPLSVLARKLMGIGDLLSGIPFQPLGFSYEGYHAFADFRQGYILALALVECPWDEGDPLGLSDDEEEADGIPGPRIPILEAVGGIIGEGLVRLIPDKGWSAADLHTMTDDTEFDGLGLFADWVNGNTGCIHLDTMGESLDMEGLPEWDPDTVDEMTNDWQQATEILDKIHRVALLLEQDPERTFRKLVALLTNNKDLIIPKEQLPLPIG